ncbi:MAG: hypothetical protein LH629_07320 [Ignavibacteria bacterium]|nr:hypothetical protein [Ignavibacteria bacterium]
MTTQELRHSIIENIEEIKNDEILNILKSVIDTYKTDSVIISDNRKKILDEAKLQIKNNEYISDEDLNKDEDNWIKE